MAWNGNKTSFDSSLRRLHYEYCCDYKLKKYWNVDGYNFVTLLNIFEETKKLIKEDISFSNSSYIYRYHTSFFYFFNYRDS